MMPPLALRKLVCATSKLMQIVSSTGEGGYDASLLDSIVVFVAARKFFDEAISLYCDNGKFSTAAKVFNHFPTFLLKC